MRRIVTGVDAQGRSTVIADGVPPVAFRAGPENPEPSRLVAAEPFEVGTGEAAVHWLWALGDQPSTAAPDLDPQQVSFTFNTAAGQTEWIITQMGPGSGAPMHCTPTVDYGLLLSGSLDLGLETGTVHMTAGDMVVMNGVMHSWSAGPQGAVIATVMVGLRSEERDGRAWQG
jgi:quercetin dioxygenase-like cupin family protein